MFLEKTSRNPLVNGHSNDFSQRHNSNLIILIQLSLLDSFEEESSERLEGVLVHLINDAKLDKQEIEHGTFSCNSSINFSKNVNLDFGVFSDKLLLTNFLGSSLCGLKLFNESEVLKNGRWISFGERLEETSFKTI